MLLIIGQGSQILLSLILYGLKSEIRRVRELGKGCWDRDGLPGLLVLRGSLPPLTLPLC